MQAINIVLQILEWKANIWRRMGVEEVYYLIKIFYDYPLDYHCLNIIKYWGYGMVSYDDN